MDLDKVAYTIPVTRPTCPPRAVCLVILPLLGIFAKTYYVHILSSTVTFCSISGVSVAGRLCALFWGKFPQVFVNLYKFVQISLAQATGGFWAGFSFGCFSRIFHGFCLVCSTEIG